MGPNEILNQLVLQYFGLASQVVAVVLLVVLFGLLRRFADRRAYFHAWGAAWVAMAIALAALVLRFNVLPDLLGNGSEYAWWVKLCYFVYQFGKLAFLVMLLRGTLLYVRGAAAPPLGHARSLWSAAVVIALLSVAFSANLQALMFWQGLCNVAVFTWCAWALLVLPAARRNLGTRTIGTFMTATMLLWLGYLTALMHVAFPDVHMGTTLFQELSGRNTYIDLILDMLLAFGMVLVLFEDAKREIDTAHNELRIAHEQLLRESLLDSMTGAYNRRAFNEGAGLEDVKGSFGALVVFDMDNLKDVNDVYGHKYGDQLLCHFVSVLRQSLRPSDKLYRLGGDEFLAVMPRAVASVAEPRMQQLITDASPLVVNETGARIRLHVSIGV
ncbi:MAG: GGDEF domain-containing protein, partial [Gammaproteobacteria bacterium]|nr:GGDEF domain-containing protein [Gammaproteobacteria bacterium]